MRFLLIPAISVSLLGLSLAAAQGPAKPKDGESPMALRVELLRDMFGEDADFSCEGMPVPLGGKLRVAYVCHGENDLATARVLYRLVPRAEPGKTLAEKAPWLALALAAVKPDDKAGAFNPKTGGFAKTKFDEQVPFFAIPPSNADKKPVRTLGGGRVILSTDTLVDSMGETVQLRSGDQIEYCVEVTERERKPGAKAATARSPIRVTSVVTVLEFQVWLRNVMDEDKRIKELERKQKDLFKEKLP